MYKALYYQYFKPYVEDYDTLEEAIGMLEGGSDSGDLSEAGVYDTNTNTIYASEYSVDRNVANLLAKFEPVDPTIMVYRYRRGKIVTGRYVRKVPPVTSSSVWYYDNGTLRNGTVTKVDTRVARNLDGDPIGYYTMGDPHKHWVEYTVISIDDREYKDINLFGSKEDAEDWRKFNG
jgi:hypothetical protein